MRELLNKPGRVLSVDPGKSGAVAVVGFGEIHVKRDFKSYRDISAAVGSLLGSFKVDHIVVELVGARPGQGVCSVWSFGEATGVALGSLFTSCPGRSIERVHPLAWQNFWRKRLGILRPRPFDSCAIVVSGLPEHRGLLKRVKDHNSADAILIALHRLSQL